MGFMARSRRATRVRLLSVLVAAALVAVACGDDDDGGGGTATPTSGGGTSASTSATGGGEDDAEADPNGVVRIVQSVSAANTTFDPTTTNSGLNTMLFSLYGTLLTKRSLTEYEPNLATRVEVIDPQTIEVELREGLVFSDDTPVDAEALKFNLERFRDNPNRLGLRSEFMAGLDHVEVTGPLSATVHLKTPTSGIFYDLFAGPETILISPTAIRNGVNLREEAVGAGPFVLESWQPDVRMVVKKNPKYWNADAVKVAGIEFIQLTIGPPVINGLRAGDVDMANIDANLARSLAPPITSESFPHPGPFILNVCKRDEPLSDVRVRQALAHAMDRDALIQGMYGGQSEPVWSLQREGDPRYDESLEGIYDHDIDKAKQLLAEAGYPDGFDTSMIVSAGGVSLTAGELLQGQWREIGVDVSITPTPNVVQDFYLDGKAPMFPITQTRAGIDAYSVLLLPGSFAAVCGYDDPVVGQAVRDVMALPQDSPEGIEAWQKLSRLVQETLPFIPMVFHNQVVAWNTDRIGGLEWQLDEFGNSIPILDRIFVKAS